MRRRIVALLIVVCMVMPIPCWADTSVVLSGTVVNPVYEDELGRMPAVGGGSSSAPSSKKYPLASDAASCGEVMRAAMKKRTDAKFRYDFKKRSNAITENATALLKASMEKALKHTGVPTEGEYLRWQYAKYDFAATDYNGSDNNYIYYFDVHFVYYTSAKQETEVGEKIDGVLGSLDLGTKDDYEVVKAIYDYVAGNVVYDHDGLRNGDLTAHTAWKAMCKGKAVCQGYSLLLYRMLLTCGIDCRMVAADDGSTRVDAGHAWNLIKVGDQYYYGDATWDSQGSGDKYFLQGKNDFVGHDKYYHVHDYIKNHPVASSKCVDSGIVTALDTGISKLSAGKGSITVKINKVYGVKGYEIKYGNKIIRTSSVSKKISKLKRKKKYSVQVRSYKTVDGVDYYSAWSGKKSVKTR